jgi:hypothetical protein
MVDTLQVPFSVVLKHFLLGRQLENWLRYAVRQVESLKGLNRYIGGRRTSFPGRP